LDLSHGTKLGLEQERMHILGVVSGAVLLKGAEPVSLAAGEFCLVPAGLGGVSVEAATGATRVLRVQPGDN
jgi:mannose-6-phosphate isomerase class I